MARLATRWRAACSRRRHDPARSALVSEAGGSSGNRVHSMSRLRHFGLALAVLCCAEVRADPRCPIVLTGDPELTARIVVELEPFGDDGSPCVALEAQCD